MQRANTQHQVDRNAPSSPAASPSVLPAGASGAGLLFGPGALMNEGQAAQYLGLSVRTLQCWRVTGRGPIFCKVGGGKAVRYRRIDLDAFVEKTLVTSTAHADALGCAK